MKRLTLLLAAALLGALWLCSRVVGSKLGRVLVAIRDAESRVRFLGYDPARVRHLVFALSGLFAGAAGGLVALNDEIVTSATLGGAASASVLVMTYIGGVGTFWGPVLGAVLTLGAAAQAVMLVDGPARLRANAEPAELMRRTASMRATRESASGPWGNRSASG